MAALREMSHARLEGCNTCEWVMAHMWMSCGTHVNELWHTCEWVMAHMWMSDGTRMNEVWHVYAWIVLHMAHVCHDSFTPVPWLIHTWAMTHSHVCHDSFTRVPWLIHTCATTHSRMRCGMCMHESWYANQWVIECVMNSRTFAAPINMSASPGTSYDLIWESWHLTWPHMICRSLSYVCSWVTVMAPHMKHEWESLHLIWPHTR